MRAAAIPAILLATQVAATTCSTTGHHGWSWREIDGRRCWYPGHRGYSKARLHWVALSAQGARPRPKEAAPVVPRITIIPVRVDRGPTFDDVWSARIGTKP